MLRSAADGLPPAAYRPVLDPLLESRSPVTLVAPPGLGVTAHEIARLGAPARSPLVVPVEDDGDLTAVAGLLGRR
ncbi:hypothetical protein ACFRMQ_30630 [Kitasatospora sp. NPDC056783]|uniref:hypothetical protein n=1 Tax=Kitasatospora sp. NPDC056783 TaxID=3345943 RepID=UPI0036C4DC93